MGQPVIDANAVGAYKSLRSSAFGCISEKRLDYVAQLKKEKKIRERSERVNGREEYYVRTPDGKVLPQKNLTAAISAAINGNVIVIWDSKSKAATARKRVR